ncbi:MAG: prepilin-type N-terminal cleavage/methylation domain-containing protein [Desulfobacterales bacterium]|jgi:prepilin-type N-terminal cleavage/methylation domain-containing protein
MLALYPIADHSRVDKGFTLLEIIAVLVILSILAAIAVPKYISLDESARQRAIDAGIAELNGRESLTWSNEKISFSGWVSDIKTFGLIDPFLGHEYEWGTDEPAPTGGTLTYKDSAPVTLSRTESTVERPGAWSR